MKYSVEVRNRFNALCEDNDDRDIEKESLDEDGVSKRYGNFITAIAETNESMIPKRKKRWRENYSADPRVSAARERLRTATMPRQRKAGCKWMKGMESSLLHTPRPRRKC